MVGKAEWLRGADGDKASPDFVVTSLPPGEAEGRHLYEVIHGVHGEMENRLKECELNLFARQPTAAVIGVSRLRADVRRAARRLGVHMLHCASRIV